MISWGTIDHVQLPLPPDSEAAADEFYGGVLGMERIRKPASLRANGGRWYRSGGVEIHLGVEPPGEPSKRHPALVVDDLAAARAHLEAHGVETIDEAPIPGRTRFTFRDPFDNRVELLEYDAR